MLTISLISAQISILLYKRLALERELMSPADKSDGRREGRRTRKRVTLIRHSGCYLFLSGLRGGREREGTYPANLTRSGEIKMEFSRAADWRRWRFWTTAILKLCAQCSRRRGTKAAALRHKSPTRNSSGKFPPRLTERGIYTCICI